MDCDCPLAACQCLEKNSTSTGSAPCPTTPGPPGCRLTCPSVLDNWKKEKKPATYIGKSSFASARKLLFGTSGATSLEDGMDRPMPRSSRKPSSTSTKKTPLSPEPSSSWDNFPLLVTQSQIGTGLGRLLFQVLSMESQHRSLFAITLPSEELLQTTRNQLEWSALVSYSGVTLVQGSRGELGEKPVWMLTLRFDFVLTLERPYKVVVWV